MKKKVHGNQCEKEIRKHEKKWTILKEREYGMAQWKSNNLRKTSPSKVKNLLRNFWLYLNHY